MTNLGRKQKKPSTRDCQYLCHHSHALSSRDENPSRTSYSLRHITRHIRIPALNILIQERDDAAYLREVLTIPSFLRNNECQHHVHCAY